MALSGACARDSKENAIRVGFFGALTGPTATFALAGRNGARLAVEEANRAGGVLGRRI